jgi:poly(rC)-binding protein 2/3/4
MVHLQYTAPISQDRQPDTWADKSLLHSATQTGGGTNYPLTTMRESLFLNRETQLESQLPSSGFSIYGQEASLSALRSSGLGRPGAPIVTQVGHSCCFTFLA